MALQNIANNSIIPSNQPPVRYSLGEWHLNNKLKDRCCLSQQTLADSVLKECSRIIDLTGEISQTNKKDVDHKLDEKIKDIEFLQGEIVRQRKEVVTECDNISTYYERIFDSIKFIENGPEPIVRKCLLIREARLDIDLCLDDVERELRKENQVIAQVKDLLTATAEQAQEQIRRLRSTTYLMDRDLEAKATVAKIDMTNLSLRETNMNLSVYHGFTPLNCSNITQEEWELYTRKNIEDAAKEINNTVHFRCYVDTILKQAVCDLISQYNLVQAAFHRRIAETKECKAKLEVQHSEIVRQINDMTLMITNLEKAITTKEGFMALNHTRLGNRAQRDAPELCRDLVETKLVEEARQIRNNTALLQQTLAEAQATLRYLMKTQIQLETDINVKINTIRIDEVDCMPMREKMKYHFY